MAMTLDYHLLFYVWTVEFIGVGLN
jgi:hypothetical protein